MLYINPGSISGCIEIVGSKSHMQRALLAAYMASGETRISNICNSTDSQFCIGVIKSLGTNVKQYNNMLYIQKGDLSCSNVIHCGESGFCFRASAAIVALMDQKITLVRSGSLVNRPMDMVVKQLRYLGAHCTVDDTITGAITIRGPLIGGKYLIDSTISSQFLSGLLLALPNVSQDSELEVIGLQRSSYIRMTIDVMSKFGVNVQSDANLSCFRIKGYQAYCANDIVIEGDWSGAAFFIAAGAIAGDITITGLQHDSVQSDREILKVLEISGVKFYWDKQKLHIIQGELSAFDFDASNCPDLVPTLVALACCANGKSRITGISCLKYKESDRGAVLVSELSAMGANIKMYGEVIEIIGGQLMGGVVVDPHNDHRIAMACAVAGLKARYGVSIKNEVCVHKSYPTFFQTLQHVRGCS